MWVVHTEPGLIPLKLYLDQKANTLAIPPDIWKFGIDNFQKFYKLFSIAIGHVQKKWT